MIYFWPLRSTKVLYKMRTKILKNKNIEPHQNFTGRNKKV